MPDILVTELKSINLGAKGMEQIVQNIGIIVTTLAYSVPFDRGFAGKGSYIDAPTPFKVASRVAELTQIIEEKEPRVKVTSITFDTNVIDDMAGRVYPRIHFELRDGVTL